MDLFNVGTGLSSFDFQYANLATCTNPALVSTCQVLATKSGNTGNGTNVVIWHNNNNPVASDDQYWFTE